MPTKPSSPRAAPLRAKRRSATACAALNQLATPGLGSLLAGYRIAGAGQLLLALAGFALIFAWFVQLALLLNHLIYTGEPVETPSAGLAKLGVVLFVISWLWSGITSLRLLREAKTRAALNLSEDPNLPPRIK